MIIPPRNFKRLAEGRNAQQGEAHSFYISNSGVPELG